MVLSDREGQGRHWAGDQSETSCRLRVTEHLEAQCLVSESLLWRIILGEDEIKNVWGQL